VLDIGCADGALFRRLGNLIAPSKGIDADLVRPEQIGGHQLLPGCFPADLPAGLDFDTIVALAVLEHIPSDRLAEFAAACYERLVPTGLLILTVPHPFVDRILDVLIALRIAHGMEAEQHHGYDVNKTAELFGGAGFRLAKRERFQLGLNSLFLFERTRSGTTG
jgi:2-polyprenyl-3-methyl-5-hydroxy-6-metoxy-1,4-benzoquinol methylase